MTTPLEPLKYPGASFAAQSSFWDYTALEKYTILFLRLEREWVPKNKNPARWIRDMGIAFAGSSLGVVASLALAPVSIVSDARLLITGTRDRKLVGEGLVLTVIPVIPAACAGAAFATTISTAMAFVIIPVGLVASYAYDSTQRAVKKLLSLTKE